MDVPIEHSETEKLPLKSHETLGVGYGFDRLYYVDLTLEQPVPRPLPGRHELSKFYRNQNPKALAYGGHDLMFGSLGERSSIANTAAGDFDNFAGDGTAGVDNSQGITLFTSSNSYLPNQVEHIAKAFIGTGQSGSTTGSNVKFGFGSGNASGSKLSLNYDDLANFADSRDARNMLQFIYNYLSPSAWETLLTNRKVYAEIPKILPYLDKAFFGLYDRDRLGSFKTRVRDPNAMLTTLSMIEAMYTIRRGRFSRNVSIFTGSNNEQLVDSDDEQISNGVINNYFMVLETSNKKVLIAPWFIVNKLNTVLYEDTDRDEEIKDVERKDLTEFMTILLEAMETERGLGYSTEQNLDLLVFEKYADGEVRDMRDFKDDKAALAATLLGFDSARDVYHQRPNNNIGRLPYYHSILSSAGTIIGDKRAEFLDRVREHAEHTILTASPEHYKNGMQYANAFDYSTMVTRTRFGDHSMDCVVHPFGFFRGVENAATHLQFAKDDDRPAAGNLLNLLWFPVYNWGQLAETCNSYGILPDGMNGTYYATGLDRHEAQDGAVNSSSAQALWTDQYYRPGIDNYCARLQRSLDEMFMSWMDRGEQVRSEGAVFPNITTMNLMAEKLFTTPMAMLQRNFPFLRKMATHAAMATVPNHNHTSFDFMSMGENRFGMSQYHNQGSGKSHPLALQERNLFATPAGIAAHPRNGELELAPILIPLTKAPENWVSVFQTRDALYFLTSMLSEPIMDAYTMSTTSSGASNGYGSARLVVYQGPKNFEGIVEDVFCTPIVGVGRVSGSGAIDYTASSTTTSVYPTSNGNNNYIMFLLGASRIQDGTSLRARFGISGDILAPYDSSVHVPGSSQSVIYTEDDFVPGLYWDKLWVSPWPTDSNGDDYSWAQAFSHPESTTPQLASGDVGIAYLQSVSGTDALDFGGALKLNDWALIHARWIENIRTDLEYARAAPSFYMLDKDILDVMESDLRASLFPLGKSTVGPLTFVGAMGHDGAQVLSETITGESCFEIIDLTTGAGDLDESPTDADDLEAGNLESPSMHIATKQDV